TPIVTNATKFQNLVSNTTGYVLQGITNFNPGQTPTSSTGFWAQSNTAFNVMNFTPISGTAGAGATLGTTSVITGINSPTVPTAARQPNLAGTAQSATTLETGDDRVSGRVYRVGD